MRISRGLVIAVVAGFLPPVAVQAGRAYQWTHVTDSAAYNPRDGAGAAVLNGRMWLLGGWNPDVYPPYSTTNEVWKSIDGAHWTFVRYAPWEQRHFFGNVIFDNKMWVVGGDPNRGHYQPDIWYSADGFNWTQATAAAPWGERCMHYTVLHDGKMWVMGGEKLPQFVPSEPDMHYNDVWSSTDGVNWTLVTASAAWSPRGLIGGSVEFNGRMWLLGGGTYSPRSYFNEVWSSADGVDWRLDLAAAPWAPREYHDVAVFDNKMWVLEGWNGDLGGNRNDVWYSSDGVNWTELPDTPWAPRHAASVFVFDNALWMVAGNNMERDVWRLDVVPDEPTGDLDDDGNVDLNDFALFADCLTGPTIPAGPECNPADFDRDADLDLADFSAFQRAFSGRAGILYAPSQPDNTAWRAALEAYIGRRCDYFDARTGTPSVHTMDQYECVFTWVNYAYHDKVTMGNNLADYVDGGGKVVLGQWCLPTAAPSPCLSGRIMSAGYIPVTGTSYSPGTYAGDGVDCVHTAGPVHSYSSSYRDKCTLIPGNVADGTFTDGWLAVAWRPDRRVYYSAGNTGADFTTGDTVELVGNMCGCGD
jgi:hypothetical protein